MKTRWSSAAAPSSRRLPRETFSQPLRDRCIMRSKAYWKIVLPILFAAVISVTACAAASASSADSGRNLRKYRIGYIEGGPYWSFTETVDRAKSALKRLGWLDRIEFPSEAHFSPGWGENGDTLKKEGEALMNRKDIDLILSAGTEATEAILAINNGRIPIVALSVSDPLQSKIVVDAKDSGVDNFTVYFEPDKYKRLFRLFHEATDFHTLGLLYSPTANGMVYSNVRDARMVARERGFKIVEYPHISDKETEEECMEGLKWLVSQGMDAFYIPALACFDCYLNSEGSHRLLNYLMEQKIPTFASEGTIGVRAGALMGLSNLNLNQEGEFLANMIVKILQGAKPRSLPMIITTYPSFSLNLYTANRIGFRPTFDLLTACDVLFRNITTHVVPLDDGRGEKHSPN